jgi:uncharacterized RDD family membrane protein YckC
MLLLLSLAPAAASAAPRDLQAHGSDERLWLARAEPLPGKPTSYATTLFVREKFSPDWRRLPPLGIRVIGLGSRGSQLAILLENGEWRLATEGGFASGRPLPGGARMLAIGSDADALWAVARVPASASTRPATRPSTTRSGTTAPAAIAVEASTAPSTPERLVLFRLAPAGWEEQGDLPPDVVPDDGVALSVGSAGGVPLVAHQSGPRTIRLLTRTPAKAWHALGDDVETSEDVREFKLLGGTTSPVLWYRGASGAGRLWLRGSGGEPMTRELNVPNNADHAVAYANGAIRVLWIDGGKIIEQPRVPDTGAPQGELSSWPVPAESIGPIVMRWVQVTLTGALVFALAASMRRRREMQEIELDPDKLRLAPLSTRLTAGIIDAVPLLVAFWFANSRYTNTDSIGFWLALAVGLGTYLLLTTLVEAIAGRSLGKLLTGLYVVGLDGKPAPLGARVMRNLLRVIDIPVMPLALIVFSPLRQRAGDLAAGTLVVRGKAEAEEKPAERRFSAEG